MLAVKTPRLATVNFSRSLLALEKFTTGETVPDRPALIALIKELVPQFQHVDAMHSLDERM